MEKNVNSFVKPQDFKEDAVKGIISLDWINGSKIIVTHYPYLNIYKKSFTFYSTNAIEPKVKEMISSLNTNKLSHIELIELNDGKIYLLENNLFSNNHITDNINSIASNQIDANKEFYVITVVRKDCCDYRYSENNILSSFKKNILSSGRYNDELKELFGDYFYTAKFENIKEMQCFQEFVEEKLPFESSRKRRKMMFTGEDIDMFREREQDSKNKSKDAICDTHMDGA